MFSPNIITDNNGLLLTIIYASLMPLIIATNLLLIIGIIKTKRKKFTTSQILFIILSMSDLSLGTIQLPLQIYLLTRAEKITCLQTQIRAFWNGFPISLSGFTILLISIDRYISVVKTKHYRKIITNKTLILAIALEASVAALWSIWYTIISKERDVKRSAVFFISLSIYEGIILSIGILLNLGLMRNVQFKLRNTSIRQKTDARLTVTIRMIAITLVISYLPSIVCFNVAAYTYLFSKDLKLIHDVSIVLIWSLVPAQLNAALNAMIYLLRNRDIKKYFKSFYKHQHKNQSITESNNMNSKMLDTPT